MWCGCMSRHPLREKQMSLLMLLPMPSQRTALLCLTTQMTPVPVGLQACGVGSHDVAVALTMITIVSACAAILCLWWAQPQMLMQAKSGASLAFKAWILQERQIMWTLCSKQDSLTLRNHCSADCTEDQLVCVDGSPFGKVKHMSPSCGNILDMKYNNINLEAGMSSWQIYW